MVGAFRGRDFCWVEDQEEKDKMIGKAGQSVGVKSRKQYIEGRGCLEEKE